MRRNTQKTFHVHVTKSIYRYWKLDELSPIASCFEGKLLIDIYISIINMWTQPIPGDPPGKRALGLSAACESDLKCERLWFPFQKALMNSDKLK